MKLTPEQLEDAKRMAEGQDLPNFSKAGTGKTHTALEAIRLARINRVLVLCPKIALSWWDETAREHLGADPLVVDKGRTPLVGDFIISTYDLARNNIADFYEWSEGGALALDESQYICSPEAKRTKAIMGSKVDLQGGLAEKYDQIWPMTGTPQQNFANDMWTQVGVLHPEVFDEYKIYSYGDFCSRFTFKRLKQFHPNMKPVMKISGNTNEALLNRIVYQEIGAIRRREAKNLPPLRERLLHVPVEIDKEIVKRFPQINKLSPDEWRAAIDRMSELFAIAWQCLGLSKVDQVVPYIGDCYKDGPILLGCWHKNVIDKYVNAFDKMGLRVAQVTGEVSTKRRDAIRSQFNNGELDVLVGQMKAMGVSWNLQEASSHVIIGEEHPSPTVIEQFYKRVYRKGQSKSCQLDIVLGNHELEDVIHDLRLRKEQSNEQINA